MPAELTDIDRKLLDQLQRELPLVERPFDEIARRAGIDPAEAIGRVRVLADGPRAPIRQISAIFDSRSLGYQSCLVAARIDESALDAAVAIINAHPGVSHNYRREHAYNVWFTLAVTPDSRLGLQGTLDRLKAMTAAHAMRPMPSLKLYKIGVKFDLSGEAESASPAPTASAGAAPSATPESFRLTDADKRMIRVLQQHLPAEPAPFDAWAQQADVGVPELLDAARRYRDSGLMRRFSAVLRHRAVGVSANAMGVWIVPPAQYDSFGQIAAGFSAVSHCYLRPTYEDWPYSLFTMVHGRSRSECEASLADISRATGITSYSSLYSTIEYKKVRVKYFVGDIEQWEQAHA